MMIRTLPLVFLMITLGSAAQHPFNYGKSKQVYFFSKKEIVQLGIKELALPSIPPDGKDNADADLQLISYEDTADISNGWFPYYGTSKKKLTVKQLRDSTGFMNGHFYRFDDNGRLVESGGEGRGALCQNWYEYDSTHTVVITSCKYDISQSAYKIYYHANGLPHYKVCCKTDSFMVDVMDEDSVDMENADSLLDDVQDDLAFFRKNDRPWDYTDTTWYVYDSKWRITGTRSSVGTASIFTQPSNQGETWLINGTRFEKFIDRQVGFRPKIILFEIYKNAVFSFTYSEKSKTYNYSGAIELE